MKRYLLFGGEEFYAAGGLHDFIASYDTADEAIARGRYLISNNRTYKESINWWHVFDRVECKIYMASGYAHMANQEVPTLAENP